MNHEIITEAFLEEGTKVTKTFVITRHLCLECGARATRQISYLLENARTNPRSSGFGRDSIVACSDAKVFSCEEHYDYLRKSPPEGMKWGGSCSCNKISKHLFLYEKESTISSGDPHDALDRTQDV